ADVRGALKIETFSTATLFDLTPFRTKPLWIMPDGRVLCVDTGLLTERLGPHAFWSIMNALDTPERRHRFSGACPRCRSALCGLDPRQPLRILAFAPGRPRMRRACLGSQ